MSSTQDSGFLSRWSRRKVQARQGVTLDEPVAAPPETPAAAPAPAPVPPTVATAVAPEPASDAVMAPSDAQSKPVPPTLADVAALTRESDFSRFVAPGVAGDVKNAALKKLFGDPQFNVMDGLDVYIDDYTKFEPLDAETARSLVSARYIFDPPKTRVNKQGVVEDVPPEEVAEAEAQADAEARVADAEAASALPAPDASESPAPIPAAQAEPIPLERRDDVLDPKP